jgi:hypothetical protein
MDITTIRSAIHHTDESGEVRHVYRWLNKIEQEYIKERVESYMTAKIRSIQAECSSELDGLDIDLFVQKILELTK